ncbi:MAG: hypothetical protein RIS92_3045, partial [Verrucomicrobiota bacterium]
MLRPIWSEKRDIARSDGSLVRFEPRERTIGGGTYNKVTALRHFDNATLAGLSKTALSGLGQSAYNEGTMSNSVVKVGMISLGCAKNLVDAEIMLGGIRAEGMEIVNNETDADVLIVNTCAF